jgi:hypothetical protein
LTGASEVQGPESQPKSKRTNTPGNGLKAAADKTKHKCREKGSSSHNNMQISHNKHENPDNERRANWHAMDNIDIGKIGKTGRRSGSIYTTEKAAENHSGRRSGACSLPVVHEPNIDDLVNLCELKLVLKENNNIGCWNAPTNNNIEKKQSLLTNYFRIDRNKLKSGNKTLRNINTTSSVNIIKKRTKKTQKELHKLADALEKLVVNDQHTLEQLIEVVDLEIRPYKPISVPENLRPQLVSNLHLGCAIVGPAHRKRKLNPDSLFEANKVLAIYNHSIHSASCSLEEQPSAYTESAEAPIKSVPTTVPFYRREYQVAKRRIGLDQYK